MTTSTTDDHYDCNNNNNNNKRHGGKRRARPGDVVTVDWNLEPENGFVPETLFDSTGRITFVLGWGNYLPGLHDVVTGMRPGESIDSVSIDAGWGARRSDLIVTVTKAKLSTLVKDVDGLHVGQMLHLEGGVDLMVSAVTDDDTVVLDGNPPLAGSSYACRLTVLDVRAIPEILESVESNKKKNDGVINEEDEQQLAPSPSEDDGVVVACPSSSESSYRVATFALGCFWGADLAFCRLPGVVGTKVGYSQGITANPSYEQVRAGQTRHRESVMIVYDANIVTYEELVRTATERLAATTSSLDLHRLFQEDDEKEEEEDIQYRHGFYYHDEEQRRIAVDAVGDVNRYRVEILRANIFYEAEEYHQKYLYKGGQSTRKGSKEPIRCFG